MTCRIFNLSLCRRECRITASSATRNPVNLIASAHEALPGEGKNSDLGELPKWYSQAIHPDDAARLDNKTPCVATDLFSVTPVDLESR
jgi:hypothetical protein